MENLQFRDNNPNAEPLKVDENGRVLRFTLKPGQSIREHNAPSSVFYVVVLKGEGMFAGGDGQERKVGPQTLLMLEPGEEHSVRALDEEFVFLGFLQGVPPELKGRSYAETQD
jgi:quercetin dioxygenase-like cupin family protein